MAEAGQFGAQEEVKDKEKEPNDVLAKQKMEFKNVSQSLIDLIENPPTIEEEESTTDSVHQMMFGSTPEGCVSPKVFGYLLAWTTLLQKIDSGNIKS
jgi:hypothetical protein